VRAIGHQVIRASAGSGKTYQLVTRYVGLLAEGIPPEEIVALTFSRKAAGEILDALVARLAGAAEVPERGGGSAREALNRALADGGYRAELDRPEVLRLLRLLLGRLHLSRVGTLDSFFAGLVRAFPLELGLTGDFAILDGHPAAEARRSVLTRVLADAGDEVLRDDFLEAYKQATFGQERKSFSETLDGFVEGLHETLLEAPSREAWGQPEAIWGGPDPWAFGEDVDPGLFGDHLRPLLEAQGLPDRVLARWDDFILAVAALREGDRIDEPRTLTYLLEKLAPAAADLRRGRAELGMERRSVVLEGRAATLALGLLGRVCWLTLRGLRRRTRGLWRLLAAFEEVYDRQVRRSGRLGFRDVMQLLAPAGGAGTGRLESRAIAWRMDGACTHWLLDEFQDTSTLQWRALRDLVDEVLQDPSGRRSLFYVGDVKQAIYGWRGGDASLFGRVLEHYGGATGGPIREVPMDVSWRSAPAIIDTVNQVFASVAGAGDVPASTRQAWGREWRPHRTALVQLQGCASLLELPAAGAAEEDRAARESLTVALLQEAAPHRRGLTAAVLVRANAAGPGLAERLRGAGIPAVWEGDEALADNPLVATLLSLARAADHPGDCLAWEHLRMGPLWPVLTARWGEARSGIVRGLLETVHARGFEGLVREWCAAWDAVSPMDPFLAGRAEALAEAARSADAEGEVRSLVFSDLVHDRTVRAEPVRGGVSVLTIHRAKGLQWDHVILPDLQGAKGRDTGVRLLVERGRDLDRTPRWLLLRPPRPVLEADPVLGARDEAAETETWYERLCLLYVAMTRARRGLDLVVTGDRYGAGSLAGLVRAGLQGPPCTAGGPEGARVLYRHGLERWFDALDEEPRRPAPPAAALRPLSRGAAPRRLPTRTPSGSERHAVGVAGLFLPGRSSALDRGKAVHSLFESLDWLDGVEPDALAVAWRGRHPDAPEGVEAELLGALSVPAIRALLRRPEGDVELWRERRFELVLDGEWISGAFDRVHLFRGATGAPAGARILDFKTDRGTEEDLHARVEGYRPQMELYRRALAAMTGLSLDAITWTLIFTAPGLLRSGPG